MAVKVVMPKLGLTMEEGTITKWIKKEGEVVQKGESLFEVMTDKANVEVEAPASGILSKILIPEGVVVPISKPIAIIAIPGEEIPEVIPTIKIPKEAAVSEETRVEAREKVEREVVREIKISPLARRLAEEQGLDLTKVVGTGPEGRIVKEDILKAIEERKALFLEEKVAPKEIPLAGIRKIVAERVAASARTAVQVTITMEVDAGNLVNLRQGLLLEIEKKVGVRLSYSDLLVKATALALKEHPLLNSVLENGKIKLLAEINIGLAVAIEEGLIVPVIRNADKKSLEEIAKISSLLVEKARRGALSLDELSGGTFTITNLGMYGVDIFTPVINPPQSGILGVGRIVEKPMVKDGGIFIRPMLYLSLTFDHRVIDGAPAAQFLQRLKGILEDPSLLKS